MSKKKLVVEIVIDGWGIDPSEKGNAFLMAKTPVFDDLISHYPFAAIEASGLDVGLPWGEVGNSEVGHTNLGAGQVIYQNLPRINIAIEDKSFFSNEVFLKAVQHARKNNSDLHLTGLLSDGGVHGQTDHLFALLKLIKERKFKRVFIHAITDGRDTAADLAPKYLKKLDDQLKVNGLGRLATIIGRYYAMDRDEKWEKTQKACDLLTQGLGEKTREPIKTIEKFYKKKIDDEMMEPIVIVDHHDQPVGLIKENDSVIFFNFRPDRARQLTKAFVLDNFKGFKRDKLKNLFFATMMEYVEGLPVKVAFPPQLITEPLGKIIADHGLKQLRIAETEKYAHVTYFFNGGSEIQYKNEDRKIIPSPTVKSFDQKPEMSAFKLTDEVIARINSKKYSFILMNFANFDMVGHTGQIKAAIRAIEVIDECLSRIVPAVLQQNGQVVITADHGNVEVMIDPVTGKVNKSHTTSPVPLLIIDESKKVDRTPDEVEMFKRDIATIGILSDVTPTVLEIMGLKQSKEMTGRSLLGDMT